MSSYRHQPDQLQELFQKPGFRLRDLASKTDHSRPYLRKQMRKSGVQDSHLGNRIAPYGWDYKGKELVANEKEQKLIFEILELYKSDLGCKRIAKILNEKSIPSKTGGRWNPSSVQNILNRHKKSLV